MAMKCRLCRSALEGFDGHHALEPLLGARPQKGTAFACALCGSEWLRRHVGEGIFAWEPWRPLPTG